MKCGDVMNTNCTHVYVTQIPNGELGSVYPEERQREIDLIKNEKLKREKYYVWRLLEYALADSFGKDISELEFTKQDSGRWSTPFCEFSLSHTDGVVAVAVSHEPVGVDVEIVKPRCNDQTVKRVLGAEKYLQYRNLPEEEKDDFFFSVWTKKEALFKALHLENFSPSAEYRDDEITVNTKSLLISGAKVMISVAAKDENVRFLYNSIKN